MAEASKGKDSTAGHWEITGIITQQAFLLFSNGFPKKLLEKFLHVTGCSGYLSNKPASGAEIINDMLILTADHGNDPTDRSTDHTREYVPVLCYTKSGKKNVNLGIRSMFADVGKTVAELFTATNAQSLSGQSFLSNIL